MMKNKLLPNNIEINPALTSYMAAIERLVHDWRADQLSTFDTLYLLGTTLEAAEQEMLNS